MRLKVALLDLHPSCMYRSFELEFGFLPGLPGGAVDGSGLALSLSFCCETWRMPRCVRSSSLVLSGASCGVPLLFHRACQTAASSAEAKLLGSHRLDGVTSKGNRERGWLLVAVVNLLDMLGWDVQPVPGGYITCMYVQT